MRARYVKLASLLALMLLFRWSHAYYETASREANEKILTMEYALLDRGVWNMDAEEKRRALAGSEHAEEIQVLTWQKEEAVRRSEIGFWLATLFGVAFALYLVNVMVRLLHAALWDEGYEKIMARLRRRRENTEE